MIRVVTVLTLVALMTAPSLAWQRTAPHTIRGSVMDSDGTPVPGAQVEFWLVTFYGRWIRVATSTDKSGAYEIRDVPRSKGVGVAYSSDPDRGPVEQPVEIGPHPNVYHFTL